MEKKTVLIVGLGLIGGSLALALSRSEAYTVVGTDRCLETLEQALDAGKLDEAIGRFLRTLPEDARNTFVGRYYFFDSLKEVARYCGMSEARAKSLLYRTRQSLKAYLVKEGFDL